MNLQINIFALYFLTMVLMSLLRVALYLVMSDDIKDHKIGLIFQALLKGIQFDNVVLSYIFLIPIIVLFMLRFLKNPTKVLSLIKYFLSFFILFAIFIMLIDFPYFQFFHNRLTNNAFQWIDQPGIMLGMIRGNNFYTSILAVGFPLLTILGIFLNKIIEKKFVNNIRFSVKKSTITFLISIVFLLMSMRGKITHPIRINDANFCSDNILNQLPLNPVFTLAKSYSNRVNLMDNKLALRETRTILHNGNTYLDSFSITRFVTGKEHGNRLNVILVLMEGMSADFMMHNGGKPHLTPSLDSLRTTSLFFDNAYSSGIHTNNGVFSSLYGYPALKRVRPMGTIPIQTYTGIPYTLKKLGYHNSFFTSSDETFDNIKNFITANHFDYFFAANDFPQRQIIGPFGVPDEVLFDKVISYIDVEPMDRPFFTTILTASNHEPYIVPAHFNEDTSNEEYNAIIYADWCIGRFINAVRNKPWFDNTLFIFSADHGRVYGETPFDFHTSFNHIPILFFSPNHIKPFISNNFINQLDIFPTLMTILGFAYEDNTLGKNAYVEKKPYTYFSADDKLFCISEDFIYTYRYNGDETLQNIKLKDPRDIKTLYPLEFNKMRSFALSQTQAAEYLIRSNKSAPGK